MKIHATLSPPLLLLLLRRRHPPATALRRRLRPAPAAAEVVGPTITPLPLLLNTITTLLHRRHTAAEAAEVAAADIITLLRTRIIQPRRHPTQLCLTFPFTTTTLRRRPRRRRRRRRCRRFLQLLCFRLCFCCFGRRKRKEMVGITAWDRRSVNLEGNVGEDGESEEELTSMADL